MKFTDYKCLESLINSNNIPTLYHGSPNKISGYWKPNISFHGIPVVYGASDYNFALCYAGKSTWNDFILNQSYYNGVLTLTEIKDGVFKEIYDGSGYIYTLDTSTFYTKEETPVPKDQLMKIEYLSSNPVKILKTEYIPNVYKALKKRPDIKLYHYPDLPPFIDNRENYIKQKANQLYKIHKDQAIFEEIKNLYPEIDISSL